MKKILTLLLTVSLISGQAMAAGNAATGNNAAASASQDNTQSEQENRVKIGVAASVQGSVRITGRHRGIVKSGMDIYLNDHVITGNTGSLQIMLLDETVFTLGPNSDLVLDEFVYNPATQNGKVSAKVTKGIFRFITGKIARRDPSRMNVKTHAGNIGIRGTIVVGQTGPEGSTVILAGPGVNNNAGERPGAVEFTFSSDNNPVSVNNDNSLNNQGSGDNGIPGTTQQTVLLTNPGDGIQTIEDKQLAGPPAPMLDTLSQLNNQLDKNLNNGNGNDGDLLDDGSSGSDQNSGNAGNNNGSSNGEENKEDGEQEGNKENGQKEDLNDQSGQSGADTQDNANDNKKNENDVSDINTLISQTTQDNNVEETAMKNQQFPITYNQLAALPDSHIMRAKYEINDAEMTGTKTDGSVIKRFLSFSTVFNFLDKLFQDTYLTLSGEPGNNEEKIYFIYRPNTPGERYNDVSSHYDGNNYAKFNISYSGHSMGTYSFDPDLDDPDPSSPDVEGEYNGFTADISFSNKATGNVWPTLTADITMTTDLGDLTLNGSYDGIDGNLYDGNLTPNEINKIAEKGLESAVYSANAKVTSSACEYPCTYNHIGLNLLATVNFQTHSMSDFVLTLTPDSDAEKNGNVIFYSENASVTFPTPEQDYYETYPINIAEGISGNKISKLKTDPTDPNIVSVDMSLPYSYSLAVGLKNPSDVKLYVDYSEIEVAVTVPTTTFSYTFDNIEDIGGGIYKGSDYYLAKNEFDMYAENLTSAGMPLAKYTYSGPVPMLSSEGIASGISMSGFSTLVDFEHSQVRDTRFFLTDGFTTERISQDSPVDITGALGSHLESNGNFNVITPYAANNQNANAAAVMNLSNSGDNTFTDATAELYFTKNGNTFPGMDVFLNFAYAYDDGQYGTYDALGNDNPLIISDIVKYEETAHKTALYQGYGSWTHPDFSSPLGGDMFRTSLSVDFDFTDGTYSNAKAGIISLDDPSANNIYINNAGGLLDGNTLTIPLEFDSSASGSSLAVEDGDYNGEQILYANVTTDETLEVPSIYAVLSPATNTADDYFGGQPSEQYRTDVKTLYDYDALLTGVATAGDHRAIWTTMINLTDFSADHPISSISMTGKELEIAFNEDNGLRLMGAYKFQGIGSYDNVIAEINNAITANTMTGQTLTINDLPSVSGIADIRFYNHNNSPAVQIDMTITDSIENTVNYFGSVAHIGYTPQN